MINIKYLISLIFILIVSSVISLILISESIDKSASEYVFNEQNELNFRTDYDKNGQIVYLNEYSSGKSISEKYYHDKKIIKSREKVGGFFKEIYYEYKNNKLVSEKYHNSSDADNFYEYIYSDLDNGFYSIKKIDAGLVSNFVTAKSYLNRTVIKDGKIIFSKTTKDDKTIFRYLEIATGLFKEIILTNNSTEERVINSSGGLIESKKYDKKGNLIEKQTLNSVSGVMDVFRYVYDDSNKLTKVEEFNGDNIKRFFNYIYDSNGNRIQIIEYDKNGKKVDYF